MRSFAVALLALALSSTAHAQFAPQPLPPTGYRTPPIDGRVNAGMGAIGRELDRARRDIERRRDSGELSRSDAKRLRREVSRIDAMADRYRSDGLSEFERRELELRASELRNRTATGRTS